jgi:hypothetical protein
MINRNIKYHEFISYVYSRDILKILQELNINHGMVIEKIREFHK